MGFHMPELLIILVVGLLIFGPKKLPEIGSAIGKSLKAFRKGMNEISNPEDSPTPAANDVLSLSEKDDSSKATNTPSNSEEANFDTNHP